MGGGGGGDYGKIKLHNVMCKVFLNARMLYAHILFTSQLYLLKFCVYIMVRVEILSSNTWFKHNFILESMSID